MLKSLCTTFQNGTLSGNSLLDRDNQIEMRGGGPDSTDVFIFFLKKKKRDCGHVQRNEDPEKDAH